MTGPVATYLTPPRLASLPQEWEQLEFSSRSIVFARDGRRLLRAWGTAERPWVVGVEPDGSRWRVLAWGAGAPAARSAVRSLFSLDHPLEAFYRQVRHEPTLAGTERRFRGLRLPRDANLHEALLHAIVGQQLSVAAANALQRRLYARAGEVAEADGTEVPTPPRPSRLRALGVDGLRSLGLSGAKSRAIVALAARAAPIARSAPRLAAVPIREAVADLTELPGVGRWTAENVLLRAVGRTDAFVAGDLGVRVALATYGAVPRSATEERARAWAERHYAGWGSYATLYLWRKLVADRVAGAEG